MKKLIKNILKEEVDNKVKKYLDYIVNTLLKDIYLKENSDEVRFSSASELMDMNLFSEEIDEITHNPFEYGKLGFEYKVWNEEDIDDDEGYFFRTNYPNDVYSYDEFYYEVIYEWLHDLTDKGLLIYDEDSGDNGEWVVPSKFLTIKLKSDLSFSIPLYYDIIKQSYFIPDISSTSLRIQIMTHLDKVYGVVHPSEMFYVMDNFIESLPQRLKELGVNFFIKNNRILNKVINNINEGIVEDFIEFGKSELSLGDDFKINLTDNTDSVETLGNYDIDGKEITVVKKNRAIPDIIRSIAHEMVHHNQNVRGDLRGRGDEGEEGSPWEDEANSKAGRLVRRFGDKNPEIYDL
jgi:hypothetical protein